MINNKRIAKLICEKCGVDVLKYKSAFLKNAVQKRIAETQSDNAENYEQLLDNNPEEAMQLLGSLQISYTEFFRNPLTFAVLEKVVIPSFYRTSDPEKQKELRIWSAACASGQEPYSLAVLLNEFNCRLNLNYRIFATDQSATEITKAQIGAYPLSAMNQLKLQDVDNWFIKDGDLFRVKPELKQNIDFSCFDLLDEHYSCPPASIFGNFDIIVCANILFYYKEEYRRQIISKLSQSLSGDGFLITGEVERDIVLSQNFEEIFPQSAIFRKVKLI